MSSQILELLERPGVVVAAVGATDNPAKFGGAIYRDLKRKGYRVLPVNPRRASVDGDQCYPDLASLPLRPDIVNFVVPPQATLEVLQECLRLGLMQVWLQPGAENAEVLDFLEAQGFDYLAGACIMVRSRRLP
jgi:predicted CoA-binding protein